jgi:hypothetical protein
MSTTDFDEVFEDYYRALGEFVKGNPEPVKMMISHREDVTLANPFGPVVRGWEQVEATMERAARSSERARKVASRSSRSTSLLSLPTLWG